MKRKPTAVMPGSRVDLTGHGKWLLAAVDVRQAESFLLTDVLPWFRERELTPEAHRFAYEIHRSVDEGDTEDPWVWTAVFRILPPFASDETRAELLCDLAESFYQWSGADKIYGYQLRYGDRIRRLDARESRFDVQDKMDQVASEM